MTKKLDIAFEEKKNREDFKKFFIKLKRKLNLDPSIEEVMWEHFKAEGFSKKENFEKGTKHFGYKIG